MKARDLGDHRCWPRTPRLLALGQEGGCATIVARVRDRKNDLVFSRPRSQTGQRPRCPIQPIAIHETPRVFNPLPNPDSWPHEDGAGFVSGLEMQVARWVEEVGAVVFPSDAKGGSE